MTFTLNIKKSYKNPAKSKNKSTCFKLIYPVQNLCPKRTRHKHSSLLGFLVRCKKVRLSLNSRRRKKQKLRALNKSFDSGVIELEKYSERVKCLLG